MTEKTNQTNNPIDKLFKAGAHFGFVKSRRHPSVKPFIFGSKDKIEIFDLTKTEESLKKAEAFLEAKGKEKASVLFVGGKNEAREEVKKVAEDLEMPYVAGRWIGGTLTNFTEIKKRVALLQELKEQKERGELAKYTKKERLLIDRNIERLTTFFSGLTNMRALPKVLVVIDPKKESIAISEAKTMKIPVVALAGSDCNIHNLDYSIPANDASRQTIELILRRLADAYDRGKSAAPEPKEDSVPK